MKQVAFQGVAFEPEFISAVRADGEAVRFTRQERILLGLLAGHPGRLFTREELFSALKSRGSDRNVDFVINRLRAKLGDSGAERRFISTQYGEGYLWAAAPAAGVGAEEFLVIGPVRGLDEACRATTLDPLRLALGRRIGHPEGVAVAANLDPETAARFRFSFYVSVHRAADRFHAAFALRHGPSGEVTAAFHESFDDQPSAEAIEALAEAVATAAWKRVALGPTATAAPTDLPLHLRMHEASVLLDPPGQTWVANGEQLARLRARDKADPVLAIMWAMHLFGSILITPAGRERALIAAEETEIEALVLEHLEAVRGDPLLALAAAKLLLGVNRGHADLAEALANAAFAGSAAFAAAFPMLGQIKALRGELAEALRLYDEGLALCAPGTIHELSIQTLKATVLIVLDDRAGVEACFRRITEILPTAPAHFGLLMLPPGDDGLARRLAPVLDMIDEASARLVPPYLYYRFAAHFHQPAHAAAIMLGPMTHLIRRFGPGLISDELWRVLPAELAYLRGPPTSR